MAVITWGGDQPPIRSPLPQPKPGGLVVGQPYTPNVPATTGAGNVPMMERAGAGIPKNPVVPAGQPFTPNLPVPYQGPPMGNPSYGTGGVWHGPNGPTPLAGSALAPHTPPTGGAMVPAGQPVSWRTLEPPFPNYGPPVGEPVPHAPGTSMVPVPGTQTFEGAGVRPPPAAPPASPPPNTMGAGMQNFANSALGKGLATTARVAGPVMGAADVAGHAIDEGFAQKDPTGQWHVNPQKSGADWAGFGAANTGRLASATAGAAMGAPLGIPGMMVGGALGYMGADELINKGRDMAGSIGSWAYDKLNGTYDPNAKPATPKAAPETKPEAPKETPVVKQPENKAQKPIQESEFVGPHQGSALPSNAITFGEDNKSFIAPGKGFDQNAPINGTLGLQTDPSRTYAQGMADVKAGLANPNVFEADNGGYASGRTGSGGTVSVIGGKDMTADTAGKEAAHRAGMAALQAGGDYDAAYNRVLGVKDPDAGFNNAIGGLMGRANAMMDKHGTPGDAHTRAQGAALAGQLAGVIGAHGKETSAFQNQMSMEKYKHDLNESGAEAQSKAARAALEQAAMNGDQSAIARLQQYNTAMQPPEYAFPVTTDPVSGAQTVNPMSKRTGQPLNAKPPQDQAHAEAMAAIKGGASPEAVNKRLQEMGYAPLPTR